MESGGPYPNLLSMMWRVSEGWNEHGCNNASCAEKKGKEYDSEREVRNVVPGRSKENPMVIIMQYQNTYKSNSILKRNF